MTILIERLHPGQQNRLPVPLYINYITHTTVFGTLLIASTTLGICSLEFVDDHNRVLERLHEKFPEAAFHQGTTLMIQRAIDALAAYTQNIPYTGEIILHMKGTDFQLKVWNKLLDIPYGTTANYLQIATLTGCPKACRAVGTAIGANPVAIFIPCHRILPSNGGTGKYHWGATRKIALLHHENY